MIKQYLILALRNMMRNKLFTFINLLSLSTGILFCLLIYIFLKNELNFDRFHQKADRIFRVVGYYSDPSGDNRYTTLHDHKFVQIFTEHVPSVKQASAFQITYRAWIRHGEDIFQEQVGFVDSTFLRMFSFPWLAGNQNTALDNLNNVVITKDVANKFFGKPKTGYDEFLGKMLVFPKGKERNFVVTGILGSLPKNSSLHFDVLVPYINNEPYPESNNYFGNCSIYVEMQPGTSLPVATKAANGLVETFLKDKLEQARKYFKEGQKAFFEFQFQPLTDIYLNHDIDSPYEASGNSKYIYVLSSIAMLVLVISCINYIMLTTGRSFQRIKEVGMRKVLGASNVKIARQFVAEALVSTVFAAIVGIVFAKLLLPVFNQLIQRQLTFDIFHWDVILFIGCLMCLISFIVGIAPALSVNKLNPTQVFRQRISLRGHGRYSKVFVVVQYALSIMLIVSTLVIIRQLHYLRASDPGFNKQNIAVIDLPDDLRKADINSLRNEMVSNSNIISVTGSDRNFLWGSSSFSLKNVDNENIEVRFLRIDPEYIETLGIPLVEGRNLSANNPSDTAMAVLVNETFVKTMGWKDPIGRTIPDEDMEPDKRPIVVGVVRDFHFDSMRDKIEPLVMHMNPNFNSLWNLFVRINPQNREQSVAAIKSAWKTVLPDRPLNYSFLAENLVNQYDNEERWSKIVGYSALLAIVISSMGLFGLTLLIITRRTKEIGIRKVNGASSTNITVMIMRQFSLWVFAAFVLAAPIAFYAMDKWLQNFAYKTEIAWWIFAGAGLLAFVVALSTVSYQTIKAALKNPVEALRYE